VRRAYLGVAGQTIRFTRRQADRYHLSAPGAVLVTSVEPSSPAANAGLASRDLLIAVGNSVITSVDDLHRVLSEDAIGSTLDLVVFRGGERKQLRVTPLER
jgi:S1-C subfamily serine protease